MWHLVSNSWQVTVNNRRKKHPIPNMAVETEDLYSICTNQKLADPKADPQVTTVEKKARMPLSNKRLNLAIRANLNAASVLTSYTSNTTRAASTSLQYVTVDRQQSNQRTLYLL